jgi:5-methylcytosine-specific restriction protein B
VAEKLARHFVGGGNGISEIVQFHPAYAYEDFMQGIRPETRDGHLTYSIQKGRLLRFCEEAEKRTGISVLIIDEINRANLSQVFGELMFLLEYRDRSIPLAAGGNFRIPANVRIIGTMNTADRSIALVDHALRRRFAFLQLSPSYDALIDHYKPQNFDAAGLVSVLKKVNDTVNDPNYSVGISYFVGKNPYSDFEDIWEMEIEPYLDELFFDQPAKVDMLRWPIIKQEILG